MIEDGVVGREDVVGEPVVANELPDVFDRVQFGAFGRQRDDVDVVGHAQLSGCVPTGLIHQHGRVRMFVEIPPHVSVSDFVRRAKGRSSRKIQQEFEHIRKR